jgi:putative nucleotidyltransferase with HDIG domain
LSKRSLGPNKRSRALTIWKRWGGWEKVALAVATGLFIAAILTIQFLPDRVSVRVNEAAREDVVSPRSLHYPDPVRTEYLRRLVAEKVPGVYSAILGADAGATEATLSFFSAVDKARRRPEQGGVDRQVESLRNEAPDLPVELLRTALTLPSEQLNQARAAAEELVTEAMKQPIRPDTLAQAQASVRQKARALPSLSEPARRLVGELVALNVAPNQFFNDQETQAARNRERERVAAQYETVRLGEVIVHKGETVNDDQWRKLQALGLIRQRIDVVTTLSLTLLGFGLVAVFCFYLYQFHPAVFRSFRDLLLISVVVCGCLLLFRIGSTALGLRFSGDQLGFIGMSSSALGAMLIAALLCPQIAVFVGVALGILTSVMVGAELKFAILSIVSSLAGVQAVTNIRNRAGILRACAMIAAINVVTALVAQGATHADLPEEVGQSAIWAAIGGVVSVMLWVLFTAWLERPFRLTTHLTLLELSDPSHALLRRLAMEAPGTYSHSIIVGNLSEAAAEGIGADGLFCRVASYYHDVGKVIRPQFFVENQLAENRHNSINPSLSSLVVTSHVKDGVELAEEHKLPPPIIGIIREHHGTCLIKYFYHRAVTTGGEESTPALEYQFRYEGPRPQTKESGIIMLADSAEAASRTLEKPTPGRIRDLIERIVRDRLADGQLDECELTFKDLEKITASMTRSLTSLLHARVEYPDGDTNKLRRMAADGPAHKEPVGVRKALADTPETASAGFGGPAGL